MFSTRRIVHGLLVAVTVAAGALAGASPAAAAYPTCATWYDVTSTDGSGLGVYVPATWSWDTSCNVRLNDYNNDGVRILQESLNECYGKNLVPDGDFGPATQTALKQVQSSLGITADGIYGPYTRDRMKHQPRLLVDVCHYYNGPGGY